MIIAVSGPGLVSAIKWAIDDHINIIKKLYSVQYLI
jgi:hypothetical protein